MVSIQQLLHDLKIHPVNEVGQVAGDSTTIAASKAVTPVVKQTLSKTFIAGIIPHQVGMNTRESYCLPS